MTTRFARIGRAVADMSWPTLGEQVRRRTELVVLDTLGCAFAGCRAGPHEDLIAAIGHMGGPSEATVWPHGGRTPAAHAALVNATVAHHAELDDGHPGASFHGGATIVPAAIAVAEAAGASGPRLLASVAAGYTAALACGSPLVAGITVHRLHPPAIVGCFGAAAAAAHVLRLDAERISAALSLAGCLLPLAPFEAFTRGAPVKDLYAGWPAYVGVVAAGLAADGLSGPSDGLDAPDDGVATLPNHGPAAVADEPDAEAILGTTFKPFATCRSVQPVLTALERLLPLEPRRVDSILAATYPFAVELSRESDARTAIGAKTSIPYCVASLIVDGGVTTASFDPAALAQRSRLDLADRVTVEMAPDTIRPLRRAARIVVRLDDGTTLSAEASAARWSQDAPASADGLIEKFRGLAGGQAGDVERAVLGLRASRGVGALVQATVHAIDGATARATGTTSAGSPTGARAVPGGDASRARRHVVANLSPGEGLVGTLGEWARSHRPDAAARHAARRLLADQLAIGRGGVRLCGVHPTARLAGRMTGVPAASLWADGSAALAPYAALANRCAGDALELAAGPECVSAAVAAAEVSDASLGELLDGLVVSAQVEEYLRSWLMLAMERHGLHPPAVLAAMASAVAAARLLELDERSTAGALASAACLAPQSPYAAFSTGSSAKTLYGGWGQMLGLWTALWARIGTTGPDGALEGTRGAAQAVLDAGAAVVPPPFEPDGKAIARVTFKPFPCNRACHAALTALEGAPPVPLDAIDSVRIATYPYAVELDRRSRGHTPIAAQLSIRTTVAMALVFGGLDVEHACDAHRVHDPRVRTVARRITIHPLEDVDEAAPRVRVASVSLVCTDGTTIERRAEARWHVGEPATDDELRRRGSQLAGSGSERRAAAGTASDPGSDPSPDPWTAPLDVPVRRVIGGLSARRAGGRSRTEGGMPGHRAVDPRVT